MKGVLGFLLGLCFLSIHLTGPTGALRVISGTIGISIFNVGLLAAASHVSLWSFQIKWKVSTHSYETDIN